MQPTEEQVQELWGWCDALVEYGAGSDSWAWRIIFPDGVTVKGSGFLRDSIDLNSLFKWAVPRISSEFEVFILFKEIHWTDGKIFTECVIGSMGHEIGRATEEGKLSDMAPLALFWTIYGIIK